MSRRCELTGKGPMSGNNVSHAKNRTRRRFLPNLQDVTLISDVLGRSFRLRISSAALRTVDHRGGFDAFLLKAKDAELSSEALKIKKEVVKASAQSDSLSNSTKPRHHCLGFFFSNPCDALTLFPPDRR